MPTLPRRVALLQVTAHRPHAPSYQHLMDGLTSSAAAAIHALGWKSATIASADAPEQSSLQLARQSDMVVILGGEDVDPRLYAGHTSYPGSGQHEVRADRAQIAVLLECAARRTPVLGIGRGMHLMNVAFGGTLNEHITGHGNDNSSGFVPVRAAAESAEDAVMIPPTPGRCFHRQSVAELGSRLRVAARAEDGVVEAIAHTNAPLTGVQWHPEHPHVAPTQLTALLRRMERQLEPDTELLTR